MKGRRNWQASNFRGCLIFPKQFSFWGGLSWRRNLPALARPSPGLRSRRTKGKGRVEEPVLSLLRFRSAQLSMNGVEGTVLSLHKGGWGEGEVDVCCIFMARCGPSPSPTRRVSCGALGAKAAGLNDLLIIDFNCISIAHRVQMQLSSFQFWGYLTFPKQCSLSGRALLAQKSPCEGASEGRVSSPPLPLLPGIG